MATGRATSPTALARAVQVIALAAYVVAALTDRDPASPSPGPPWTSSWLGTGAVATVLLAQTALFAAAARRARSRGRPAAAWWLLALPHPLAAVAIVVVAATVSSPSSLVTLGSLIAALAALIGGGAALLVMRTGAPRWVATMWVDASAVAVGALALASAAAGLALNSIRPDAAASALPPVSGGVVAFSLLVALLLGAAGVVRPAVARPLWRLAAGLAVVTSSAVVHQILVAGGDRRPDAVSGTVMLGGFVLAGLAASPRQIRVPVSDPGDRRRGGPLLTPVRVRWLPTLLSATSLAVLVVALAGAQMRDAPGDSALGEWLRIPWTAWLLALACLGLRILRLALAQRASGGLGTAAGGPGTDDLTGLADRRALTEALAGDGEAGDLLDVAGGVSGSVSVLIVDIDRFKEVNDGLGHEAGDRLLPEVGRRLQTVLRPHQMLARLSGDEFAVLLPGADAEAGRRVAEVLRQSLTEPFEIDGSRVHLTAAVGIAACRPAVEAADDLLRRADVAMYAAKASGAGIEVYDRAQDGDGVGRLRRIDELRAALANGDLEVHLQPQVDLGTGAVTGAEALARWRHPRDGVLLPHAFLPLAAQIGLMRPVAALVLDRAVAACAVWWSLGHRVTVSVNVTADDLRDPALPGLVEQTLQRHGMPTASLCIEITEDALLTDPTATAEVVSHWRRDGVSVAVDDYGTGYSSLSYLRELPIDEVKLDQIFAADLDRPQTVTIVEHTVAMAHGLRLRVVAEGIEDARTAKALTELGCDVGQGLFFGGATTPEEFVLLLERQRD